MASTYDRSSGPQSSASRASNRRKSVASVTYSSHMARFLPRQPLVPRENGTSHRSRSRSFSGGPIHRVGSKVSGSGNIFLLRWRTQVDMDTVVPAGMKWPWNVAPPSGVVLASLDMTPYESQYWQRQTLEHRPVGTLTGGHVPQAFFYRAGQIGKIFQFHDRHWHIGVGKRSD